MRKLLAEIRTCDLCAAHLPHGPRPVVAFGAKSRILIIGQAPGRKVHETGIPWNDASGKELRRWLGVEPETFYDPAAFALLPMGFCFPGSGKSGDLPPRPECEPRWHGPIRARLKAVRLTLLVGRYAQDRYLGSCNVTANVAAYAGRLPEFLPLPHPSPRNKLWFKRNPWFEAALVPDLRARVERILAAP